MTNQRTTTQPDTNNVAWQFEQFRVGADRFRAHESPKSCDISEQMRGYMSALEAQQTKQLPATSRKHLEF